MKDPKAFIEKHLAPFTDANGIKITLHGQTQAEINRLQALADKYTAEEFFQGKAENLNFAFGHNITADERRDYKLNVPYHIKPYKK